MENFVLSMFWLYLVMTIIQGGVAIAGKHTHPVAAYCGGLINIGIAGWAAKCLGWW